MTPSDPKIDAYSRVFSRESLREREPALAASRSIACLHLGEGRTFSPPMPHSSVRAGSEALRSIRPASAHSLEQNQEMPYQDCHGQENRYSEEEPERILLLRLGKR